ncbi:hypothetical protein SK128_004473 [Halocaridina rubra]|uniref:Uncharacterized protein n=1 Tax=Halocaridina rubra TaxID=373956 RepID=A0AAN8XLD4_HALRR
MMDASNEFRVLMNPSNGPGSKGKKGDGEGGNSGVRQRLVPVINKVFSPSHFMLAQRKTTVYKAVSGVSFQDIDIGSKKRSGSKRDKRSEETSTSEGERSLMSSKSDKSVRSLLTGRDNKSDARKQRHSLGSHEGKPSFLRDSAGKELSSDKSHRGKSATRTRSVSATENLYITHSNTVSTEEPPVRPQRSRSASRPRKSETKIIHQANLTNKVHDQNVVLKSGKAVKVSKSSMKGESDKKEDTNANETLANDALENNSGRSRPRKKPDSPRVNSIDKKSESTKNSKNSSEKDSEEPEGGYFSLEKEEKSSGEIKFIYEALPNISCEEYAENDQCVETIYVCQVFKKESDSEDDDDHIYENYQIIKMTKEGKVIDDDETYENYQIIRQLKESEFLGVPKEEDSDDEDVYEGVTFINENQPAFTALEMTEKRSNPLIDSNDSIPFIDDSDNSLDEMDKESFNNDDSTKETITVITINDNKAKITRKESPHRTKIVQLRSSDGLASQANRTSTSELTAKDRITCGEVSVNTVPEAELDRNLTLSSGIHTSSSETSTLEGLSRTSSRHSYPAASALIPKLCDKISRNMARLGGNSESVSTTSTSKGLIRRDSKVKKCTSSIDMQKRKNVKQVEENVKKSMSHNDVESHMKSKGSGFILSQSFSDEDIKHNEEFESFSETDSELDNIDYDLFTPKAGKGHPGRKSPVKGIKSKVKVLENPLMTSTPCSSTKPPQDLERVGSVQDVTGGDSPTTFQDLLDNRCLNPPETDIESQAGEDIKVDSLIIQEVEPTVTEAHTGLDPRDHKVNRRSRRVSEGDQSIFDDAVSFTWSDAESDFEFIDFKKAEPPKTCVVYQSVSVSCDSTPVTTSASAVASVTTQPGKKVGIAVKRSQSMKADNDDTSGPAGMNALGYSIASRFPGNVRFNFNEKLDSECEANSETTTPQAASVL